MMHDPYAPRSKSSSKGRTNLASCIVATVFLLILAAGAVVAYFLLLKPKAPKIAVDAVQFPTFSASNGTVNFTFFQYVTVTNPNRDEFTHYDSSLQLVYSGQPVGLVFIPAGKIQGGRAQHMSAKFNVQSYPLPPAVAARVGDNQAAAAAAGGGGSVGPMVAGPTMEIETRMKLEGRVRVLKVFTHRVDTGVRCGVVIEVTRGSVLGFHC
ncbi:uncharacterized protein LOC113761965 [Coffea eugenioides]|uniref:uncharacterized protein LOC113761602 n=1 Tax=Coffea eugenioides TaxID=49369 RepID=UPI000F6129FF|nr:uncharacterized protein LOC113761602 [Coffea eugenioides]XP_027160976.1 uncharacterized protein LOC113761965 [Coffea eugenioides]